MSIKLERSAFSPQRLEIPSRPSPEAKKTDSSGFSERLGNAFRQVESAAQEADTSADDLMNGRIDIHQAMVSMEKANLMLQLGTNVRDKLLDAYQKLLNSGNG